MASALDILKKFSQGREIKAEAIASGISAITGSRPAMRRAQDDNGEYIEITPTPEQAVILRKQLESWLAKDAGDVRVNLSSIWAPVVLKKALPWAAAAAAALYIGRKAL